MRVSSGEVNFTQGEIVRSIARFSVPLVLGELLQTLYNSMDALAVGNFVSENALAAVTVCGTIAMMVISFFNGMSVGVNVVISRAFGKGDKAEIKRKIRIAFTFSTLLGILLSVFGMLLAPQMLRLASTRPEYYADALAYLRIYLAGLLFTVLYNNGAGILRAVGASNEAFIILVGACAANIGLDLLLTAIIPLGVVGVGAATVISQMLSAFCAYRAISRRIGAGCFSIAELRREGRDSVMEILGIGIAAGVQNALIGISNLFVVRYMNLFDTLTIGGIGIGQKVDRLVIMPAKTFGITMTTFVSQNLGAKKPERIEEGKRKTLLLGLGVTFVLCLCAYIFACPFACFFNRNEWVVSTAFSMIRLLAPYMPVMCLREVYTGYLRGFGKSFIPMVLNLIGMIAVRQGYLFFAMRREVKVEIIYYCYPISWIATTLLIYAYYLFIKQRIKKRALF